MSNVKLVSLSRGKDRNVQTIEATFSKDGVLVPLKVNEDDRKNEFDAINEILETEGINILDAATEIFNLMSPEAKVSEQINSSYYLSGSLGIRNGHIFFGEEKLEETLANHMMSLLDSDNTPKNEKTWRSYVKFLDNLYQNANEDIRKQLFRWMEYENQAGNGFGITEDGHLVGYKGCGGTILEPMSKFTGFAIVDGEEYNGHIPNKVGSVVQMPRSAVQNDPSVGCSVGLHVGTRDYAVQWAPVLLLVKVNPRDVVSVPYECDSQKMRVCEYTVLKVTDAEEEHQMFHSSYDEEYDGDEEFDFPASKAYDLLGKEIYIEYDNGESSEEGKLVDVYEDGEVNIIIETEDEDYTDIELKRVTYYEVIEDEDSLDDDETGSYEMTLKDAYELNDNEEEISIVYDGKTFEGRVVDVYDEAFKEPGVIVKNEDGEYKHIKLFRITDWNVIDEDEESTVHNPFFNENQNKSADDELNEAIDGVFKALNGMFPNNDDTCEDCTCGEDMYEPIYSLPLGTEVLAVYEDRTKGIPELKAFSGQIIGMNKCDMEITLINEYGVQQTINLTDVVSFQEE